MKTFRQLAAILLILVGLLTVANVSATPQEDIARCTQKIQQNPNDADSYFNRGNAYYDLKQYERAIQDYSKAIALNTNYAEAYFNRGIVYYNLGQYERAILDYNKALEFKQHEFIYNNRGNAYSKLGQKERAILDFDKAIELNPNYAMAYNNRGYTHYKALVFSLVPRSQGCCGGGK